MRLVCRKSFPLLLLATLACVDTTAPVRIPASFGLANINGRALPAPSHPSLNAGPTVLAAYVILDASGKARMFERQREIDGTISEATNIFDYEITGDQIEIGSFSPCGETANCVGTYKGTISNDALSLTIQVISIDGAIVYNYRRVTATPD